MRRLTMPIENRNLQPGTRLIATYKKETFHALVVAGEDGKPRYQLSPYDGREFKSPSSLGTAVTGKSCNGWAFWSVDTSAQETSAEPVATQEPAAEGESDPQEQEPEAEASPEEPTGQEEPGEEEQEKAPAPVTAGFRRVPNQRGVPEGEVRLYCDACKESFTAPVGQQPDTCPMGHEPV
jgi:hypothetical protein